MSAFPPPQLKYKLALIDIQEKQLSRLSLWRSCFIFGCAIGIGLLAICPSWQIKDRQQIKVDGSKMVSYSTIHNALKFSYPQFIWEVNGLDLTRKVESIPSVAAVNISKKIIPPQLIISVREKTPVAVATSQSQIGFLDVKGQWIDKEFYDNISNNSSLPKLKVLNYQSKYQKPWIRIYELISLYPELKIDEVRWNQSGNLLIQTKIGKVFLGADFSQLERQFEIMLKLQNLPERVDRRKIAYIDLSNPNFNLIQKY